MDEEFDLDITVLESHDPAWNSSDQSADPIRLTDDGCGSSCPSACATNAA